MKKLIYSAMIMAMTALAFTSCEDVPAPYDLPSDNGGDNTTTVDPTGTGTKDDPYNVAAAVKYIEDGGSEEAEVYVKGIVVSVVSGSYDATYGSLKYYISDDGTVSNQFYVFNGYAGPNRTKFTSENDLKAGDEVVICGKLITYSGTKEFQTGNYLVSLNGKDPSGGTDTPSTPAEATGDGTLNNPYNFVAATNLANSLADNGKSENVYIKGKISEIKEEYGTQYGNGTFYISDDGTTNNQFYVYRALYLENKKFVNGNTQIKVGDEVIIYGQVTKYVSSYGTTLETVQNATYLYSLNGKTTAETGGDTGGDDKPVTTSGLISNGDFETWEGSTPTNWKSSCSASSATLSQSTDAHGGSYSVSVGYSATGNKRLAYKEITLKPGTYTFSFYAKATTSDPSQCRPGYVPVTDGSVGSYAYNTSYTSLNNSSWTLVTHEFTLTETTTICLVVMNPKTSNYATAQAILIDDASLTTTDGGLSE